MDEDEDIYRKQLELEINWVKDELRRRAYDLSTDMLRLAERTKKDNVNVNSIGEVQGRGSEIDTLCSRLSTLQKQLEIYDSLKEG